MTILPLICLTLLLGDVTGGKELYVEPSRSDTNAGTIETPFRTIGKAVSVATAGDTVYVRAGTYHEAVTVWSSGTALAPIQLTTFKNEKVVIDGRQVLPLTDWMALIHLAGGHIHVAGFEVRDSRQRGIALYGRHNVIRNVEVHGSWQHGILILGDEGLVEDSRISRSSLDNYKEAGKGMWGGGLSAGRDLVDGITSRAIMRRNTVFGNWGEGLSSFEAEGTVIEDNVIYDNFSVNLYVSDTRYAIVQRNIVYNTAAAPLRGGRVADGIALWDEVAAAPRSDRNTVINNLVHGTFGVHTWDAPGIPLPVQNHSLIAHNTVVGHAIGVGPGVPALVKNNLDHARVAKPSPVTASDFRSLTITRVPAIPEVRHDFFGLRRKQMTMKGAIDR